MEKLQFCVAATVQPPKQLTYRVCQSFQVRALVKVRELPFSIYILEGRLLDAAGVGCSQ